MNHFKLFLNASTQMIFIVYASLSVLHVFHVSTFLNGWQGQPWQSGLQVYLVRAPLVGWAQQTSNSKTVWKETLSFTPLWWAAEERSRDPESLSGTPAHDVLHLCCYGGAQTQATST